MAINLTDKKKTKFDSLYHQGQSCKYCYGVLLFCIFKPHFYVICDLLLERCTATWNLFVNYTTNWLLPNFSRSFEHRHPKDYVEKTSKFWNDLSSHKEQNKGNSRIIHSFVGLIYPNLIEEHCKFTVTENVLISISVEPSFRGNPQNQESVS